MLKKNEETIGFFVTFLSLVKLKHVLAENDKSHFAVSRKSRLKFQNSQTDFVVQYSILLKNIFHSNDVSNLLLVLLKFQYFR